MLIAHVLRMLGFPRRPQEPQPALRLAGVDWPALSWKFATSWAGERREISPGFDIGGDDWREVIDPDNGRQRVVEGVDPVYGTRLRLRLWYIERAGDIRIFAAGEVGNGMWLVFVPKDTGQHRRSRSGA